MSNSNIAERTAILGDLKIKIVIVIVIALCLQYVLKGYHRKFFELLTGTPPHLTLNQVSYHSAESTEEIA